MKTVSTLFFILFISTNMLHAQSGIDAPNQLTLTSYIEDDVTILQWETNREVNTSHFQIEKSTDGVHYVILDTQKAGSSTYANAAYEIEDVTEVNAFTKYRIALITMDGKAIYSEENADFATAFAE